MATTINPLGGHDYLRLSVTDRCNLRCAYCMPADGVPLLPREEILTFEEIERLVRILSEAGVSRVKVTGGEPLVRRGIARLVETIAAIAGVEDLSMTTNGLLLARHARSLRRARLGRVNVSLDTLSAEKFRHVTRGGRIERVLEGIDAALMEGLRPVKVNVVLVEGFNEDEITPFLRFAAEKGVSMKFIEEMPTENNMPYRTFKAGPARLVMEQMRSLGAVEPLEKEWPGPARYYRVSGLSQPVGIVSAISAPFCADCSRLRLTATGQFRPCLYSNYSVDLRSALRGKDSDEEILRLVAGALLNVDKGGSVLEKMARRTTPTMSQVGG